MNLLKKIFGIKEKQIVRENISSDIAGIKLRGLEKFKAKSADDRLRDIMILGDTGHSNAYHILEYAIENDTNPGVVMAALKRIHKFQDNKKVIPFLNKLVATNKMEQYEPYFSMALSRTGILTIEEFKEKVK